MLLAPIVEIFCDGDDFYKNHIKNPTSKKLSMPPGKRQRKTEMSESEMMTIVILFHLNHYRTFKDFYCDCILSQFSIEFPNAFGYSCFVALMPRLLDFSKIARYKISIEIFTIF
jgi:hypothetical protein